MLRVNTKENRFCLPFVKNMKCLKALADHIVELPQHVYFFLWQGHVFLCKASGICTVHFSLWMSFTVRLSPHVPPLSPSLCLSLSVCLSLALSAALADQQTKAVSLVRALSHTAVFFFHVRPCYLPLWCQTFFFLFWVNTLHFTCRTVQMDGREHACVPMPSAHYLLAPPPKLK